LHGTTVTFLFFGRASRLDCRSQAQLMQYRSLAHELSKLTSYLFDDFTRHRLDHPLDCHVPELRQHGSVDGRFRVLVTLRGGDGVRTTSL